MDGSGGPHDCPETLGFEAVSGRLQGRAVAGTPGVPLSGPGGLPLWVACVLAALSVRWS